MPTSKTKPFYYLKLLRNGQITLPKKIREILNTQLFKIQLNSNKTLTLEPIEEQEQKSPKEIIKELEQSNMYTPKFIQSVYTSLLESKKGESTELTGSLADEINK